MNRNDCDIARDLMPLSVDGVCSEGSQRFLDGHVAQCPPCRDTFARMKAGTFPTMKAEPTQEAQALKQGLRYLGKRFKALWITIAVLVCAFVLLLTASGIQQMRWHWTSVAPLEMYNITSYSLDAMHCMDISASFPQQTYNGFICDEQIVTTKDNHTDAEEAVILTYSVSYFSNQATDFMASMTTDEPQSYVAFSVFYDPILDKELTIPQTTNTVATTSVSDYRFVDTLQMYKMCVNDGKLYLIDQQEGLMTTYGRPLMLLTPGLPVSEIRFTDGKDTITLYTWGDEIINHSADRVDEYGLAQSGIISPSDYERFKDFIQ